MLDGTNYNSPCSFADEIVEYIYDEMNGETKATFETHLAKCNSCADELAGFDIVHSKISNWKTKEFSPMITPDIQLPIYTQVKRHWFENLRDLLTISPVWLTQSAAFAGLLICFGFVFYAINYQKVDEVMPPVDNIASATPKVVQNQPIKVSPTPIEEVVESPKKVVVNQPTKPTIAVVKATTPTSVKKIVIQAVQTEQKPIAPKNKLIRQPKVENQPKQTDVNLVSNEEDEDDSLRLSDLFEEISMK